LIAFAPVVGLAFAADKIILSCTQGTFWSKTTNFEAKAIPAQSLVIDFDRKTVTGSFGDFSITSITDTHVLFSDQGEPPHRGQLDRVSGSASISSLSVAARETSFSYELSCKPAKPLF
jgi:hypothetical protein